MYSLIEIDVLSIKVRNYKIFYCKIGQSLSYFLVEITKYTGSLYNVTINVIKKTQSVF